MKKKGWKVLLAYVCTLTMLVGCFSGMSFISKAENTKITFSDFGLENQTVTSNTTTQGTLTEHDSFDGLTFHGYASFSGNSDFAVLKFGDKIDIFQQGGCMYVRYNDGSEKYIIFDGYETYNQEIEIQLGFTYVGNDVELTFKVDDREAQTKTLSGMADDLTKNLLIWAPGSITIKSVGRTLKELTFSDYSFSDGDITTATWNTPVESLTDLDGVAFTGNITFRYNEDRDWFIIGGKNNGGGIRISQRDDNSLGHHLLVMYKNVSGAESYAFLESADYDTAHGTAFKLRMTFDKVGEVMQVKVWVNDIEASTLEVQASSLGTQIGVQGVVSEPTTIASVGGTTEEPEDTVKEITFSDFGLENQTVTSNTTTQGTLTGHDSFDGLTFHGYASFSGNSDLAVLKFGDKIDIFQQGGCMYVRYNDGSEKYIIFDGYENYNQEIKIQLGFKYVGNDVELTFAVDDKEVQTKTLSGMADDLTTNLLIWAPGSIKIKSVGGETEEPGPVVPQPDDTPYTELTFKDYSYENGPITNGMVTEAISKDISNLHHVAISGQISFKGNSDQNWLSIAEKATGMGICIYQQNDVIWAEDRTGKGAGFIFSKTNSELGIENGELITFCMTFDYAENNNVTLKLWLNEEEIGTKVVEGYAEYLGVGMTVFGISTSYPTTIISTGETYAEPDEEDQSYRELTFWDYGLRNGKVTSGEMEGDKITDLSNLDKVAFVGQISFKDNSDRNWLRLATDAEGNGITLFQQFGAVYLRDDTAFSNGSEILLSCENKVLGIEQGDTMSVRLTFDYETNGNVKLNLWINEYYVGQRVMENYAQYLSTGLTVFGINVDYPTDIQSVGKEAPLSSYALWEIFLKSEVNMKYYGFTNEHWEKELDAICK